MAYELTNKQTRSFMLLKHGLMGSYRFTGKQGVMDFVKQAGCIQYDPLDICGKNAELVLQSRVKGFDKRMLYELLYDERSLIDYFDKNLAIMKTEDWKYFSRSREWHKQNGRGREEINKVCDEVVRVIREKGSVCSADIGMNESIDWYWSDTRISRAALETMYFRGNLIVHHKKGAVKYYAMAEDYLPREILSQPDPFPDDYEHMKWRVLRRIGAVGLLWNKPSDAWLNIGGLKSDERNRIFAELMNDGEIIEIKSEGISAPLYCLKSDEPLLFGTDIKPRCELLAPLDNLLWDRKLIKAVFDFDYKWEVYTPADKRVFGYYTLPVLYGDRFIGRIEPVVDRKRKVLMVKNLWYENGVKETKKLSDAIDRKLNRFAEINGCGSVER